MKIPESIKTTDELKLWLKENDFDGMFSEDCACSIDDLEACGQGWVGCDPGYKMPCDCWDHDYHIGSVEDRYKAMVGKRYYFNNGIEWGNGVVIGYSLAGQRGYIKFVFDGVNVEDWTIAKIDNLSQILGDDNNSDTR